MKFGWILVVVVVFALTLTACSEDTSLTFDNQTECGLATITITNLNTGNSDVYEVAEGEKIDVKIDNNVSYRYNVEYAGPDNMDLNCESRSGTVLVPNQGQNSTFRLLSATQTPAP